MWRFSIRTAEDSSRDDAPDRGVARQAAADRHSILAAVLLTTIALAYFYATDNFYLSTGLMSPIFQYLLMAQDEKTAWLALGICLIAVCWKNPSPILKVVDFVGSNVIAVAMASVALLSLGAVFIYHNTAFCMDEYAAVFQAKVFAAGKLSAQLPPSVVNWVIPPAFNGPFLIASRTTGRAIEAYWPGFSLLLAPFEYFGAPWLCNAILSGFAVWLIRSITLEITGDRRASGWAVVFTIASGAFAAYGISYYSMQAHMTANLLFVWLLLKPTPYRAIGAGVVGSLALILHNPFPHTMFAIPWILDIARKGQHRVLFQLLLGYLPILILIGAGWLYLREIITSGDSGFNVISTNLQVVFSFPNKAMLNNQVAGLVKMWVWAVPGLILFAVRGRMLWADNRTVRLLAQSAVLTFVGYVFFIFDQGHGWGYRYFHSAWGVIPILAGCAMAARKESNDRLTEFAGAAAILSLVLVLPFQMSQIDGIIARHSAQLPKPRRPGNNAYFVRGGGGFYTLDLVQTDPLLRGNDLILFSAGAESDADLRRRNWPDAVLVERHFGVEEWNLSSNDQRQESRDFPGGK